MAPEAEYKGIQEGGDGHSSTGDSTTASAEVTTMLENKRDVVSRACSYHKITEEKNSHWLPQIWTPHYSVISYIARDVVLLCHIFICLCHCTQKVQEVFCLLVLCVCDSTSSALKRTAQKELQQ